MGLDQIAIKWVTSYLEDQEQIVDIASTHSDSQNINSGVPQGLILGRLLFLIILIYVNDMRAAVNCKLLHYADGTALLASGRDISETERVLSLELEYVSGETDYHYTWGKQSILFG